MKMETRRLFLREMTIDDFEALYAVLADSDIMQHYPYTFDEMRVRNWISKNIERYRVFGFGLWAVCLKENGEMIGDCGLSMQSINGTILPEIGYSKSLYIIVDACTIFNRFDVISCCLLPIHDALRVFKTTHL